MEPRDYCGFEMDITGHYDLPGFEVPTPSTVEAHGGLISGDFAFGRATYAGPAAGGRRGRRFPGSNGAGGTS